jgi:hypothetical protein
MDNKIKKQIQIDKKEIQQTNPQQFLQPQTFNILPRFAEFHPLLLEAEDPETISLLAKENLIDITVETLEIDDIDEYNAIYRGEDFYLYLFQKEKGPYSCKILIEYYLTPISEQKNEFYKNRYLHETQNLIQEAKNQLYLKMQTTPTQKTEPHSQTIETKEKLSINAPAQQSASLPNLKVHLQPVPTSQDSAKQTAQNTHYSTQTITIKQQ